MITASKDSKVHPLSSSNHVENLRNIAKGGLDPNLNPDSYSHPSTTLENDEQNLPNVQQNDENWVDIPSYMELEIEYAT